MKILKFMAQETNVSKQHILLLAIVSGVAHSLLLIILNQAVTDLHNGTVEIQFFLQYILAFFLFIYAQRISQQAAVNSVEKALQDFRVRIVNKIRQCDVYAIEKLGNIRNYSALIQGANTITQSTMYLVRGAESLLVLFLANLYLLWLSPISFFIAIILISFTVSFIIRHYRRNFQELSSASEREGLFFEYFTSMLKGFKQIKINNHVNREIFLQLKQTADETYNLKRHSNIRLLEDILVSNITFYLLLLLVVFLLPILLEEHENTLFQVITTILFMLEPVFIISASLPSVSKTNVAINSMYRLEKRLDNIVQPNDINVEVNVSFDNFKVIHLKNISFTYTDNKQHLIFSTPLFNISCQRGEIIFITGCNGSGKSTFLKLLTGLYLSEQGYIQVDNTRLETHDYSNYRELFSIVFNDFYVFEHLQGIENFSSVEINHWLKKLGLSHVTHFEKNHFTHINLSTGQQKRLAFLIAIIENRPILVLDELATDQDIEFRQVFYNEIIPELKEQGKTIIMVTHDNRYFSIADQVFHLDNTSL